HSFEIVERQFDRPIDPGCIRLAQAFARRREGAGHSSDRINIHFASEIELALHIAQRPNIAGNQRSIELVSGGSGALKVQIDVDTATRKTRADLPANTGFQRSQFLAEPKMKVKIAVIDGFDLNRDCEVVAVGGTAAKSSH